MPDEEEDTGLPGSQQSPLKRPRHEAKVDQNFQQADYILTKYNDFDENV